jgi:hypothetical protein
MELELRQRRVEIDPSDALASERVGWVLWFTGRAEESLPWLRRAVAQRPEGRWGHFFLGVIWSLLAAGKDEEARDEQDADVALKAMAESIDRV